LLYFIVGFKGYIASLMIFFYYVWAAKRERNHVVQHLTIFFSLLSLARCCCFLFYAYSHFSPASSKKMRGCLPYLRIHLFISI
jgi:hypothetical protein